MSFRSFQRIQSSFVQRANMNAGFCQTFQVRQKENNVPASGSELAKCYFRVRIKAIQIRTTDYHQKVIFVSLTKKCLFCFRLVVNSAAAATGGSGTGSSKATEEKGAAKPPNPFALFVQVGKNKENIICN